MITTIDILRAARELISDPARWTQGAFARNELGMEVKPESLDAKSFCAAGAIDRVDLDVSNARLKLRVGMGIRLNDSIAEFNDTHTHAEVLAAFDRAIAVASLRDAGHR